jgi:hypothetical protein
MNSSTMLHHFDGYRGASPRSAIRKIGILSLRERRLIEGAGAVVLPVVAQVPVDQHGMDAESDVMTDVPSSAEVASTISIARFCKS